MPGGGTPIIVTHIPDTGIKGVPASHHAQFTDVLHRQHAVVEDGVRTAKSMGLRNLPSKNPTTAENRHNTISNRRVHSGGLGLRS